MRLHVVDHLILVAYLVGMMLLGWRLSKRQHSDEEYFLGGRRMPWFAVGVSLIATLLSSVAYLGTPGVVWRFGFAIFLNTLVGHRYHRGAGSVRHHPLLRPLPLHHRL